MRRSVRMSKRVFGVCGVVLVTCGAALSFPGAVPASLAAAESGAAANPVADPKAAAKAAGTDAATGFATGAKEWLDYAGSPEGNRYVDLNRSRNPISLSSMLYGLIPMRRRTSIRSSRTASSTPRRAINLWLRLMPTTAKRFGSTTD